MTIRITFTNDEAGITYCKEFHPECTWMEIIDDGVIPGLRALTYEFERKQVEERTDFE